MAQLRGSKAQAMASILLALLGLMLLNSEHIESKEVVVGGEKGWNTKANTWSKDRVFHVNDVLVFKYAKGSYNVVEVDKDGYKNCIQNEKSALYVSGKDRVKLHNGTNYFICTMKDYCSKGMKMAIKVV